MNNLNLRDIIDEEFQHEVEHFFGFATGFGVVFIDNDGYHLGEGSNFCDFCNQINSTENGRRCCASSNKRATTIGLQTQKPSIYICHAGLINIEIPLIYENCCVGAITAGQVLCLDANDYPFDPLSSKMNWLESEKLATSFKKIKTVSLKQVEATSTALYNISNYIVQNVAYNKIQKQLAEQKAQLIEYERKQFELQHLLKLAQLDMLEKQVTPHFMFNVINTTSRLISMNQGDTAKEMLDAFAQMMRYSLSNTQPIVDLKKEIEYINNYLMIQKIRFGDKIDYSITCSPDLESFQIPIFSLQPLIENALQHGILSEKDCGFIRLKCVRKLTFYQINIQDNGIGMPPELLTEIKEQYLTPLQSPPQKHIGLYNCYNRLYALFGKHLSFKINSKFNLGTNVEIKIPIATPHL